VKWTSVSPWYEELQATADLADKLQKGVTATGGAAKDMCRACSSTELSAGVKLTKCGGAASQIFPARSSTCISFYDIP